MRFRAAACALLVLLLPLAASPAPGDDGSFLLEGPIEEGAAQRFRDEAAGRDLPAAVVILNSPGGLLLEGMALGRAIRERGYSTTVAPGGMCHSACVFALLGGVYRFASAGSSIGVHRFSSTSPEVDADAAQLVSAAVMRYIRDMGADVDLFERMSRRGGSQILVLGPQELRSLGVINDGRLGARWVLRIEAGAVVLSGTQATAAGNSEVKLSCHDDEVLFEAAFTTGDNADALVGSAAMHLMRLGDTFMPLPSPIQPLTARDGTVSATFALGPGHLKRLAAAPSIGYAVRANANADGFAVDTAGSGAETIRSFLASCRR